jgi:repressor LexA
LKGDDFMTIGDRIKLRREELGMTQEDLATKLGYKNRSTVNKWEKDGSKLQQRKIKQIADALNTTPTFLIDDEVIPEYNMPIAIKPTKNIPIVGTVACGNPLYAEENILEYITVNETDNVDFALYAEGDSMNNCKIDDGDIIYIRAQSIVENGEIALVLVNNDTATVKRFYDYGEKIVLRPDSTNSEHKEQVYEKGKDTIAIQGKVIFIKSYIK